MKVRNIVTSIKGKIVFVVSASLILSVVGSMSIGMKGYGKIVRSAVKSNLINGIASYGKNVETSLDSLVGSIVSGRAMHDLYILLEENPKNDNEKMQSLLMDKPEDTLKEILEEHSNFMYEVSFSDMKGTITMSTNQESVNGNVIDKAIESAQAGEAYYLGGYEEFEEGKGFKLYIPVEDEKQIPLGLLEIKMSSAYLANIIADGNHYTEEMYLGEHQGIQMEGLGEAPLYILDSEGTLLIDANRDYVGRQMPELMYADLCKTAHEDDTSNSGIYEYIADDGNIFYMGYAYFDHGDWYIVVEVDSNEVLSSLKSVNITNIIFAILLLVTVIIISCLIARSIAKPIEQTTETLKHMAELDFTNNNVDSIALKTDETGMMAESIKTVVSKLQEVFREMGDSAMTIHSSSLQLNEISQLIEENAKENLAITQNLVAGMEESVATFEEIDQSVTSLRENSNVITQGLAENVDACNRMLNTANKLNTETEEAASKTRDVYSKVRADADIALIGAKAVDKVNTMANAIKSIAEQTSLLALNASIEAARAGESGKGFAVVAEEIGKLANQSSEIVSNITEIINEVNVSVAQMTCSLETSLSFMEENVLNDYEKFIDVSSKYSGESLESRDKIQEITSIINELMLTLEEISKGIHSTAITLEASSRDTGVISEKNTEVVEISTRIFDMAAENKDKSEALTKLVEQFKV